MVRTLMHAKLHGARVTDCNLDYVGSITIDRALMEAVGLLPYEQVQVVNKANGARLITYVIEGAAGSLAAATEAGAPVIAYGQFTEEEARRHRARVAFLSPENRVVELND